MSKPRFNWRHQYDESRDIKEGDIAALECKDESLTQQSFAKDADLNVIAKRFGINEIPVGPLDPALFRDTSNDPDLRTILEHRHAAREAFAALPAKLQKRFHYNPAELWNFVTDPENAEESERLGLLTTENNERDSETTQPGDRGTGLRARTDVRDNGSSAQEATGAPGRKGRDNAGDQTSHNETASKES